MARKENMARNENLARKGKMERKEKDARKGRKERKEKDMFKFENGPEKDQDHGMEKNHSKRIINRKKGVFLKNPRQEWQERKERKRGKENTRQLLTLPALS